MGLIDATSFHLRSSFALGVVGACVLTLCGAGCSHHSLGANDPLMVRLNDRGPIALSESNPYLAGNLFLSREIERSAELKGFIEVRGTPNSLEIENSFFSPTTVLLHYHTPPETYQLLSSDQTWIITGPIQGTNAIVQEANSAKVITAATAQKSQAHQAALRPSTRGSSEAFQSPALLERPTLVAALRSVDADAAQRTEGSKMPRAEPARARLSPREVTPVAYKSTPKKLSGDTSGPSPALRALIAAAPATDAEISPRGDLVHYVTQSNETLSVVARWFTFDGENAARLARMNQLGSANGELSPGDVVVIPSYMLKNRRRLTSTGIEELSKN